jgi:hypothetical protein
MAATKHRVEGLITLMDVKVFVRSKEDASRSPEKLTANHTQHFTNSIKQSPH